ncbi:MAG: bifunctional folylpolyglutamate synthase/dihydrofolate synthase [Oscillospiraceae bacterium]
MNFSYQQSLDYLAGFSKQGAPVKDLSRFAALMRELGDPQNSLRFIHIAGTNGKGSVTELCARALTECGYAAGRFTSPYIIDIRERIELDGQFISEEDFARLMHEVKLAQVRCDNRQFSQFELLTALCFLYYAEQRADFVCLEAGIGGTLDCTNLIPRPAAAVITSIGLDHTAILGRTEAEIACSKSGIIKGGKAVAAHGISSQALAVIKSRCDEVGAELIVPEQPRILSSDMSGSVFEYRGTEYHTPLCGAHQVTNCATAIETLKCVAQLPVDKVRRGFDRAVMPARLERFGFCGTDVILDGGHNPQAIEAAKQVISCDNRAKTALIGMIDTKDFETALASLLPCFERVIFCDGFAPNAVCADSLCGIANRLDIPAEAVHEPQKALERAIERSGKDNLLFCGGSLYLAAEIRKLLLK